MLSSSLLESAASSLDLSFLYFAGAGLLSLILIRLNATLCGVDQQLIATSDPAVERHHFRLKIFHRCQQLFIGNSSFLSGLRVMTSFSGQIKQ